MSALRRLAQAVGADGGALERALVDPPARASGPGRKAAAGPRVAARAEEYELVVEAIHEGYLLHYGGPRLLAVEDPDLALLAGDRLYALGLARLVELGDVDAVAELADVIGLAAVARARGDSELADAVWDAGARAIGWGPTPAHEQAKRLASGGDPAAAGALRASAGG